MFIFSGPLRSRAAKAIGFIDMMIDYSIANAPLQKELSAGKLLLLALSILFDGGLFPLDSPSYQWLWVTGNFLIR